jgi:hypothetical protein
LVITIAMAILPATQLVYARSSGTYDGGYSKGRSDSNRDAQGANGHGCDSSLSNTRSVAYQNGYSAGYAAGSCGNGGGGQGNNGNSNNGGSVGSNNGGGNDGTRGQSHTSNNIKTDTQKEDASSFDFDNGDKGCDENHENCTHEEEGIVDDQ